MLYALIDIGSSTIRMAIYDITVDMSGEKVEMLYKDKQRVGLAGFVDDGVMNQQGIMQVCQVLEKFKSFLEKLNINNIIAFTTAALRNCCNSKEAVSQIVERTGIEIKVVSGEEEAELDFVGATHGMTEATGILMDIGGGSTELVYFKEGHIVKKVSLPIGSLSYKKNFVKGLLPAEMEIQAMRDNTRQELHQRAGDFTKLMFDEICGIGGTFKGAWSLYQHVVQNDFKKEGTFDAEYLKVLLHRFQSGKLDQDDTLILLRSIPERLETVMPGLVIADFMVDTFGAKHITYSDTGMREGFIYREILPKLS